VTVGEYHKATAIKEESLDLVESTSDTESFIVKDGVVRCILWCRDVKTNVWFNKPETHTSQACITVYYLVRKCRIPCIVSDALLACVRFEVCHRPMQVLMNELAHGYSGL
jgi:hypothetical protein